MNRVEVYKGDLTLQLRPHDVNTGRLSQIFKVVPRTLFLEEEATQRAEFADKEGKFLVTSTSRYKVCGDEELPELNSAPPTLGWSTPRPWVSQQQGQMPLAPVSRQRSRPGPSYECFFKRCIPLVSLTLDRTKKNISVLSTLENVYIRVPESSVCVPTILAEMGRKVSRSSEELVLLDSKLLLVSDDKELDYWKTPSRRLYVCEKNQYEELTRQRDRKRLSLRRKRAPSPDDEDDDDEDRLAKIETTVGSVMETVSGLTKQIPSYAALKSKVMEHFECKICKCIPDKPVVTSCCNQLFGCNVCYRASTEDDIICPLCRSNEVYVLELKGFDSLLADLAPQ